MSEEKEKITVAEILNSIDALKAIANENVHINAAVKMSKVMKELDETLVVFNESKNELFETYGEKKEDGQKGVKIKEEHLDVFNEKYTDILSQKVDISFTKIDINDLGDIKTKTTTLMSLGWLFNI